jgi:hypothetical protein
LGRLISSEQEGFAIASAKMKYKEAQAELKSACQLYGPSGMWDLVVKEQAAPRKRQQDAIEEQARQRDRMFWGLSVVGGALIFIAGCAFLFYGAAKIAEL